MRNLSLLLLPLLAACAKPCPPKEPCPDLPPPQRCAACCVSSATVPFNTGPFVSADAGEAARSDVAIDPSYTNVLPEGEHLRLVARVVDLGDDDCSFCSSIVVGLPAEVKVVGFSASGDATGPLSWHACTNAKGATGMITIDVPEYICVNDNDTTYDHRVDILCEVEFSPNPHAKCNAAFSVHAMSSIPDPHPANNYWYWDRSLDEKLKCR